MRRDDYEKSHNSCTNRAPDVPKGVRRFLRLCGLYKKIPRRISGVNVRLYNIPSTSHERNSPLPKTKSHNASETGVRLTKYGRTLWGANCADTIPLLPVGDPRIVQHVSPFCAQKPRELCDTGGGTSPNRLRERAPLQDSPPRVRSTEGPTTLPGTVSKHIRIDQEVWERLEAAARNSDTTANRLLAELASRWLETREWPQSAVQVRVARSSLFAAQAIARDMIAAGRQKEVDDILKYVSTIVPDVAPEPPVEATTASEGRNANRGNT